MSLHSPLVVFVSFALLWVAADRPARGHETFQPMFTDSELTGWVRTNTPPETWRFEDGVLYCTGKPIGELRTDKMYQNFIMELEWRHRVPRGNAGVFVWADDITSRGVPFHRGIEVQVLENAYGDNRSHTTHGDIFPIHGATMTPINGRGGSRAFPTEKRSNPSPQWNHYRIECRDGDISLAVNGKVVTRGKDCIPRKGYICLESEGGVVEYRNVRIHELPGEDLPTEQVAIADRGYRSLYSGLNLDGWQPDNGDRWRVEDWVLSYVGQREQTGRFASEDSFDDAGFVVDARLQSETSNLVIDFAGITKMDFSDATTAKHLEPNGRWNRIELRQGENQYRLLVNDHEVKSFPTDSDRSGKLVLQPTGPVDFANLYASDRTKR